MQNLHRVFDQLNKIELFRPLPKIIIADDPNSRVVGARTHRTIKHRKKQLENNVRGLFRRIAQRVSPLLVELRLCIPQAAGFLFGLLPGAVKVGAFRFALLPMQSLKLLLLLVKLLLNTRFGILGSLMGLIPSIPLIARLSSASASPLRH
ncbi:hypothetical protein [Celeribacter ethanolicus]|nr:hypothetical protein [Celeribacter ethanolicus]